MKIVFKTSLQLFISMKMTVLVGCISLSGKTKQQQKNNLAGHKFLTSHFERSIT